MRAETTQPRIAEREKIPQMSKIAEAQLFLSTDGKLLHPNLAEILRKQIELLKKKESLEASRKWWTKAFLPESYKTREEIEILTHQITFKLEAYKNMVKIFDSIESLPQATTEMAKWGAEEIIAPWLERALEGDENAQHNYLTNREIWFKSLERMSRASQAWRMVLQVSDQLKEGTGTTTKIGGLNVKENFITEIYLFMDPAQKRTYQEFVAFIDKHFASPEMVEIHRALILAKARAKLTGKPMDNVTIDRDPNPETKINEALDPLFYEYLWMVVNGETTAYLNGLGRELKAAGKRAELAGENLFQPQIWLGAATDEDVTQGRAAESGDMLKIAVGDLAKNPTDSNEWLKNKLSQVSLDAEFERQAGHEQEASVWFAIEVDLNEVLGEKSSFAWYIKTIGAVERPLLQLAVPLSVEEAKILTQNAHLVSVPEMRDAIIDAWIEKDVAMVKWHGFGAEDKVFMTPASAMAAFNTLKPTGEGSRGERITKEALSSKNLKNCLKGRLVSSALNVLGSRETGIELEKDKTHVDSAGSMERAAWYVLEVSRALGLLPGQLEHMLTIMYGHSMGGQIALRIMAGLMPETARNKVHVIASTPLSTVDEKIDTFLHRRLNNLARIVISLRPSNLGEFLAKMGEIFHIDIRIIRDMIRPKSANDYGLDLHETLSMEKAHLHTYKYQASVYLKNQMKNISESIQAFAQHTIDDLLFTAGVASGDNLTVLIGWLDEVLNSKVMLENFDQQPHIYQKQLNLLVENWREKLNAWVNKQKITKNNSIQPDVIVGNFAHYPTVNQNGRITLAAVLEALVAKYGFA